MSSLQELVEERAGLFDAAVDQLQAIVSDWQILADLSFADLLLCHGARPGVGSRRSPPWSARR
mgnify:CR=1 FL=1